MYRVPEDVQSATTKCGHDFSCLKNGKSGQRKMCPVQSANGSNVLFLSGEDALKCPYWLLFGSGQICTCPTHFACYQEYGI